MATNQLVGPMLTDFYQISMAYAYWIGGRAEDNAVFELFFRKTPFNGEFCIFAGLDEVLHFVKNYRFTSKDIDYLRTIMPHAKDEFWPWLESLDCSKIKIYGMRQGEPLLRLEGPLAITQLLETTLLNLINFASLVTTNAVRMKVAANTRQVESPVSKPVQLLEFGLRRAQGPDGGISASKYSYLGGFDGTSNVLAGMLCDIAVKGTHAHAFVMSYRVREDLRVSTLISKSGDLVDFHDLVMAKRRDLHSDDYVGNYGELLAFMSYAISNPNGFIALVDTYDTLSSGIPNFLAVGLALHELGYAPVGIRLDSGDLSYLSKEARKAFKRADETIKKSIFHSCRIIASNDIDEKVILSLNTQGHEIDVMAVGTKLVTCYSQPALGCVYKLVEINGNPCIKLSQDSEKIVIPSKKSVYRLIGKDNRPILDIMIRENEEPPQVGQTILCRHPFMESKRANVKPSRVEPLLRLVWDGLTCGIVEPRSTFDESRKLCWENIQSMREDHIRSMNATPYKVSLSDHLFQYFHQLIQSETPIAELS